MLTVWDFDWSMVDDNSDTWVIDKLGARPSFDTLKEVRQTTRRALPTIQNHTAFSYKLIATDTC